MKSSSLAGLSALGLYTAAVAASITVLPGGEPKPYRGAGMALSRDEYFRMSAQNDFNNVTADIILSSHDQVAFGSSPSDGSGGGYRPSSDSFVRGAIEAWGQHLHLVVRPDEVWFTILTQMNFFMNAHAEAVRDLFVAHQGQEVVFVQACCTWADVLIRFQDEIQARVKTPWLRDWIAPNFTTTTAADGMTANVLMMGLTQAYFKFEGDVVCGLPSVTLLGERADWEALLAKLDRLADFGAEAAAYGERLRPILRRFVRTFEQPDSAETVKFWNNMVAATEFGVCGDPPYHVWGWITGFHYWDDRGRPVGRSVRDGAGKVTLDGVTYPRVDPRRLPVGYANVPFIMHKHGGMERFPASLVAGTLGKAVSEGPPAGYAEALLRTGRQGVSAVGVHSTLQPLSGWALYGPVDYNRTINRTMQDELATDVLASLGANFDATRCAARP
ncbi:hypothetical protein GGTG_03854 [Gaeumannomyces tritici R3-111a-1]|uniref:DUF4419 domain-containing protein n=1 Tax=Gaeumannomyces tritici (strain R3-111a-1) TaxID=644352 RepID=J3NRF0_GAET3|nr:hypothetical protein GGTG_03854 [Gaeumannomyces tritici R3-111a-1]EJT78756.1 hypothetical protein GGTG_03854 [Gaeumannomyces tritici R3-111a-1]